MSDTRKYVFEDKGKDGLGYDKYYTLEATVEGSVVAILAEDLTLLGTSVTVRLPRDKAVEFGAWLVAQTTK
jgi:hypothetical protein